MGFVELFVVGVRAGGARDRGAGAPLRHRSRRGSWASAYGVRLTAGQRRTSSATYLRTGRRLRFVCSVAGFVLPPLLVPGGRPDLAVRPVDRRADRRLHGRLAVGGALAHPLDARQRCGWRRCRPAGSRTTSRAGSGGACGWSAPAAERLARARSSIPPDPLVHRRQARRRARGGSACVALAAAVEARAALDPAPAAAVRRAPTSSRRTTRCARAPIHALAGSGICSILLLLRSLRRSSLAGSEVQVLRWTMPWVALASSIGAMVAIRYYVVPGVAGATARVPPLAVGG